MFITFEGIDGCGKSTQIALLAEFLRASNKEVITLREPGGTAFSESLREALLHSKNEITPVSELLLFEAARAHLVEYVIKPALKEGKVILSDRFYDSTTAYQGYGRNIDLDFVTQCNLVATGGLKPDITFYLDIPLEEAQKRSNDRVPDRMERSGEDFFLRVINGFREIVRQEPGRVIQIDAMGDWETTHNLIKEKIIPLL
jgi:dTMP kinase